MATTPTAEQANPFNEQLFRCFEQLNVVNGLLYFLDRRADEMKKEIRESLKQRREKRTTGADLPFRFTSSSVPVSDLSVDTTTYASGGFSSLNEAWVETLDDIVKRDAAVTVAQGYEIFESFLYGVLATYFLHFQAEADAAKAAKFKKKNAHQGAAPTDWIFWRRFAQFAFQENKEVFKALRHLAPSIAATETTNWRKQDLKLWYEVVSEVRHGATHTDGVITGARIKKRGWTKHHKMLLEIKFPSTLDANGNYSLRIPTQKAQSALEVFADYGFAVYKSLSMMKGYNWRVLR